MSSSLHPSIGRKVRRARSQLLSAICLVCTLALAWQSTGGISLAAAIPADDVKPYVYHIEDFPEKGQCGERRSAKSAAVTMAQRFGGAAVGSCKEAGYTVPVGTYDYKVPLTLLKISFAVFEK